MVSGSILGNSVTYKPTVLQNCSRYPPFLQRGSHPFYLECWPMLLPVKVLAVSHTAGSDTNEKERARLVDSQTLKMSCKQGTYFEPFVHFFLHVSQSIQIPESSRCRKEPSIQHKKKCCINPKLQMAYTLTAKDCQFHLNGRVWDDT